MSAEQYPLKQVLEVKERRVEEAERVVSDRKKSLEKEEEKLKAAEEARDKVLTHKQEKLQQLRDEMDAGTTPAKITAMKRYLDLVKEKLVDEEKKVAEQQNQVDQAKRHLDEAIEQLRKRRIEVDKIKMHESEWTVEARKEATREENKREAEIGQQLYLAKQRKGQTKSRP